MLTQARLSNAEELSVYDISFVIYPLVLEAWKCKGCEYENDPDDEFCSGCGEQYTIEMAGCFYLLLGLTWMNNVLPIV